MWKKAGKTKNQDNNAGKNFSMRANPSSGHNEPRSIACVAVPGAIRGFFSLCLKPNQASKGFC
ncbi:MAG TPA: hypothetical protein PLH24_06560, partial [Candidatus Atribacteria bacterium]|nr:hypothetical protein [Candidatus Atribacteria bacterium]